MPLVVGTDTYVSLANAQLYLNTYGETPVTLDESSLARATLAIDRLYRGRFKGTKTDEAQPLEFPRDAATTIPASVEHATAELAAMILGGTNVYAQPDPVLAEEMVKIDVLQTSRKFHTPYFPNALHLIEVILSPVLYAAGGIKQAEVVRG